MTLANKAKHGNDCYEDVIRNNRETDSTSITVRIFIVLLHTAARSAIISEIPVRKNPVVDR